MRAYWRSLLALCALLIAGAVAAQERQGWLGAGLDDVTRQEADKLGWESPRGAKITDLAKGSPAAAAGLELGDVIATFDGIEVENSNALAAAVMAKGAGALTKLRVMRAGKERTVTVALGARPGGLLVGAEKALQLTLDTGGHMAKVLELAITPDGKRLVSGSNDKTVRIWDIETGKAVRIIRGESAPGDWGALYAMALSPDGARVAVGGFLHANDRATSSAVRIHDLASGKVEMLLKGHTNVVGALAFSPDGKRLVSGSSDKTAIIWDLAQRQQVVRLSGHGKAVKAVAFTNDGDRLVTGSEDQTLRLWRSSDGALIAEMTEHKLAAERDAAERDAQRKGSDSRKTDVWFAGVGSVAASPTEHLIASGSADGRVLLWDARTGVFLRQLAFPGGLRGAAGIFSLSFSADGRSVLSTSTAGGCLISDVATGLEMHEGKLRDRPTTLFYMGPIECNGGTALAPDGRLAAAGYNSTIRLLDAQTPKVIKTLASSGKTVQAVAFADEGRSILWGDRRDTGPDGRSAYKLSRHLRLPLDGRPLGTIEYSRPEIIKKYAEGRVNTRHGPLSAAFKAGPTPGTVNVRFIEIFKDGKLHAEIDLGEASGAGGESPIPFTPDGQAIIVGMAPDIRAYDLDGRLLGHFVGHNGQVRDLAPSPDGRFLVSGATDQTVRLWNLKTRELIVTLFNGSDDEWVMWTPQGYYTGSPGADKIVGWQINKGPEQAPEHVGAEQLRQHLHRPDIIEKAIMLASAEQAVREAPGTSFKLADLLARPVPRFKIVSPAEGSAQSGGRAIVQIVIEATPDPIRSIRAQVNGRQVAEETPDIDSGGFGAGDRFLSLPLAKGRNNIRVTLTNAIGEKAETLTLTHNGDGDLDKRGTLHILAIGVDKYPGLGMKCGPLGKSSCDLNFSGADARKLAEAIEARLGPSHTKVVKRILVSSATAPKNRPTAANIVDAVGQLRKTGTTDTVAVFISGHGHNEGASYRFLPTNAAWDGDLLRSSTVVSWQILQEAVEAAKGRRILFVDTCHSGNAYNQRLGNAAYHANIVAYTAARFDQLASESSKLKHGLFTYAVAEGLGGKASRGDARQITTKDLAEYVAARVGELAKEIHREQEPQYFKSRDAEDFVLAPW
jgi:WD40 repeat protein